MPDLFNTTVHVRQAPTAQHLKLVRWNVIRAWHIAGASENAAIIEMVAEAVSPEEAARLGRRHQRLQAAAVRPDWDQAKLQVMLAALRAKVIIAHLAFHNVKMHWMNGVVLCACHPVRFSAYSQCLEEVEIVATAFREAESQHMIAVHCSFQNTLCCCQDS